MPKSKGSKSSTANVAHEQELREQGKIRVPDLRSPAFRAAASRQSMLVALSEKESEDQEFIDAVSDLDDR